MNRDMTPMEAEARRKYARSVVTPEEQAAIDAAIAAGKARRIPRGVSAYDDQIVWDADAKGLRYADKDNRPRFQGIAQRRARK